MLEKIQLKFGANPESSPLKLDPEHMTIFVGPNNSGKSLILREIEFHIINKSPPATNIISSLIMRHLTVEEVKLLFSSGLEADSYTLGSPITSRRLTTTPSNAIKSLEQAYTENNLGAVRDNLDLIYQALTMRLDGQARLTLIYDQSSGDLLLPSQNLLQSLFQADEDRKELSILIFEAFGYYYTIDPTGMQALRIKMSEVAPTTEEKNLDRTSKEFFEKAKHIGQFSDGVKAFVGIMSAVFSNQSKLILIDEPEAFLHPPLVRKLGKFLTDLASKRNGNVLAATHSSDFLIGSIQSRKKVNVVRLTYQKGVPTARLLPSHELKQMMQDPFLRSAGVLAALFHTGAVVCEADMDRAFYQEINERLLEAKSNGVDNCLFLNANGKDSISRIVKPLRNMGIPTVAVVDLDIIENSFNRVVIEDFIPSPLVASFNTLKDKVKAAFEDFFVKNSIEQKKRHVKKFGVGVLPKPDKESAEHLLDDLGKYGIFVVPVGEVEKWLPHLALAGHGPYWLGQAFEKMGSDPTDPSYTHPTTGDVWDFVRKIASWVSNPDRKGMPK